MENDMSASYRMLTMLDYQSASSGVNIQSDEANPSAPASIETKAKQFTDQLNEQQLVTEMKIKYEDFVFDSAQNIEITATYSEPAAAAKL